MPRRTRRNRSKPKSDHSAGSASLPNTSFWTWVLGIGAIVAILAGIAGAINDSFGIFDHLFLTATATRHPTATATKVPTSTPTFPPTATPLAFDANTNRDEEPLILIAKFYHSEGVIDAELHNEISHSIRTAATELGLTTLQVQVIAETISTDSYQEAEELGKQNGADMIIWGSDTGVRVTVYFLNLREPDYTAGAVTISETERTQIANPGAYSKFVTTDLPAQLNFLTLFALGQSYYLEEDYNNSVATIAAAIASLAPGVQIQGLTEAYFRLGWLYQIPLGNSKEAVINYDRVIELSPEYANAFFNRGTAHYDLGEFNAALNDLSEAIKRNPNDEDFYHWRGLVYSKLSQWDAALADFTEAININPSDSFSYYFRGNMYVKKSNFKAAIDDYTQAITIEPDLYEAYNNRGSAYHDSKNRNAALEDFNRAIRIDPNRFDAYIGRGGVLAEEGHFDEALVDFNTTIALNPNAFEAYYGRGKIYYSQGKLDAAIAEFTQVIKIDPSYADAYYERGLSYTDKRDFNSAIDDFNLALALNPQDDASYFQLSKIHFEQVNIDEDNLDTSIESLKSSIAELEKAVQVSDDSELRITLENLLNEQKKILVSLEEIRSIEQTMWWTHRIGNVFLVVGGLLLLVSLFFYYRNRRWLVQSSKKTNHIREAKKS